MVSLITELTFTNHGDIARKAALMRNGALVLQFVVLPKCADPLLERARFGPPYYIFSERGETFVKFDFGCEIVNKDSDISIVLDDQVTCEWVEA